MPLLTFTSAPGVRKFRVEEVTIVDYGNCARAKLPRLRAHDALSRVN